MITGCRQLLPESVQLMFDLGELRPLDVPFGERLIELLIGDAPELQQVQPHKLVPERAEDERFERLAADGDLAVAGDVTTRPRQAAIMLAERRHRMNV